MNIVKFKDIMLDETDPRAPLFNEKFRGKYCWCVNWKWCVSFDDMDEVAYCAASSADSVPEGTEFLLITDCGDLADQDAVTRINSIDSYILSNSYVPSEFTLDQIKKFRTFTAESLLANSIAWDTEYDETLSDKITKMLTYYKNGMLDEVIKTLAAFSDSAALNVTGTYTDCGCGGTTSGASVVLKDQSGMYRSASSCGCSSANAALLLANTCDCVGLYRGKIRNFMIDIFSDWRFWDKVTDTVVPDMIEMLKAILEAGLPLSFNSTDVIYGDCSCLGGNTDEAGKLIISNLIKALTYIKDEDVVAHKNFVKNSLFAWASKLYEWMEW